MIRPPREGLPAALGPSDDAYASADVLASSRDTAGAPPGVVMQRAPSCKIRCRSRAQCKAHMRACMRAPAARIDVGATRDVDAGKEATEAPATQDYTGSGSRCGRRLGLVVRRVSLRALQLLLELLRAPGRRVSTRAPTGSDAPAAPRRAPRRTRAGTLRSATAQSAQNPLHRGGADAAAASG